MNNFVIIFTSLLSCAFFSGIEMAFVSSNRFQIELEKKKKNLSSLLLNQIYKNPRSFITSMLIGNNIAIVVYGIYMGDFILKCLSGFIEINFYENSLAILLLQTLISTLIILLIAEFFPKAFFGFYAYEMIKLFIIPAFIFYFLFYPISRCIVWICKGLLQFSKEENLHKEDKILFDKKDLGFFLSEKIKNTQAKYIDSEVEILYKALDFWQLKVRECMIPRNEIISSEINTPVGLIKEKFIKNGLSKIIIYKDTIDNVIGYIHYLELLKQPKNINSILFPILSLHISMGAQESMNLLIKKRKSLAIVLDEYGGIAGLVTLEDLLEEFLGDIEDEYDKNIFIEKKIKKGEFIFSARLEINYLNEKYKLELPKSEEYETLGGLIVSHSEDIPSEGEKFTIEGVYFEIRKVSKNKIEEILVKFH